MLKITFLLTFFVVFLSSCKWEVTDPDKNKAPLVAVSVDKGTAAKGETVSMKAVASDIDGKITGYQWVQRSGENVDLSSDNTRDVSFVVPDIATDSSVVFRVTVTDDDGATSSVNVTVKITSSGQPSGDNNQPPQVTVNPATITLEKKATANISVKASDADGTIASYQWRQVSGTPVTLNTDDNATISVTAPDKSGQAVLQVTVTDNKGATASANVTITIKGGSAANQPPKVNIGSGSATVEEGKSINIDATASDPDGTVDDYQWSLVSGANVTFSSFSDSGVTVTAPMVSKDAKAVMRVVVTDDKGATASAEVTITITNSDNNALIWPNEQSSTNGDQWLRDNHDKITEMRPRVLVLDPDVEFPEGVAEKNAKELAFALAEGSRYHGYKNKNAPAFLNPQIVRVVHLRDPAVIRKHFGNDTSRMGDASDLFTQEFANHIGWKDPDNPSRNMTLCELFEKGHINEVWNHGLPTVVFETQSRQQRYDNTMQPMSGKFNNCANGCTKFGSAGQCKVTVRIMFVNPRRGTGCDVHGHGHMMENLGHSLPLLRKYDRRFWGKDPQQYYSLIDDMNSLFRCRYNSTCFEFPSPQHAKTKPGHHDSFDIRNWGKTCGMVHFAPNSTGHYDYRSQHRVANSCENYGLGNGQGGADKLSYYDFNTTIALDRDPRFSDCGGGWQIYMRQSMPGFQNKAKDEDGNPMKNWWPFLYY